MEDKNQSNVIDGITDAIYEYMASLRVMIKSDFDEEISEEENSDEQEYC